MTVFVFPDVGEGLSEGDIVRWLVKVGDTVKKNQALVEMETAKAVVEIPSPQDGVIAQLHGAEGDTIQVGSPLVTFGYGESQTQEESEPKKEAAEPVQEEKKQPAKEEVPVQEAQPTSQANVGSPSSQPSSQVPSRIHATPHTRKLARDLGVDISTVQGSGPSGRVTDADVKNAANGGNTQNPAQPTPSYSPPPSSAQAGSEERIRVRGLRKAIADNMTKSWHTVPHVTHVEELDVTDLVHLRTKEKDMAAEMGIKLTYMPFIMKALIIALKHHPQLNASFDDDTQEIILKHYFNFGMAVDTPDGLIVPNLKNVDQKSILQLAKESQELAQLARDRKVGLDQLTGGTFTITNIGSIGGVYATPIISHPEVAILATFAIQDRPVVINGEIIIRKIMPMALSFDHRVTDGANAARFMQIVKKHLEDPALLLLDS